ncbi:MAG: type II secretion system GspH family protein [Pirellulales bacterium]|nr:type II secretion system GspH family protein [Pirellulales bacterium]
MGEGRGEGDVRRVCETHHDPASGATAGLSSSASISVARDSGVLRTPYESVAGFTGAGPGSLTPATVWARRRGFTLIEVLVVITIIGIIAGLGLGALFQAQEVARRSRTKGLIARLHTQMASRWDSYRTRRLPIDFYDPATGGAIANASGQPGKFFDPATPGLPRRANGAIASGIAGLKLAALRELMRMELPDRYNDLLFPPDPQIWTNAQNPAGTMIANLSDYQDGSNQRIPTFPALRMAYLRRVQAINPSRRVYDIIYDPTTGLARQNQRAECLYLIMTTGFADENDDIPWHPRDVADTDNDGMPEFVDGWGTPIEWIRWPAGFYSELQPIGPSGDHDATTSPDPFDPRGVDRVAYDSSQPQRTPRGYALFPLIMSAGPDGSGRNDPRGAFGVWSFPTTEASSQQGLRDPYFYHSESPGLQSVLTGPSGPPTYQFGTVIPPSDFGNDGFYAGGSADDNIHNHQIDARQ